MQRPTRFAILTLASVSAVTGLSQSNGSQFALPSAEASTTAFTVQASADAYVRYDTPSTNDGNSVRWSIDGRSAVRRQAFVKFQVPSLPAGSTITGATLAAKVETSGASYGPGPIVHRTSGDWAENTLTWGNRPALGTQVATTSAPYSVATWVSWDVTGGLTASEKSGGGTVSFGLTTAEKRWLGFKARESGMAPKLTVTTTAAEAPAPQAAVENTWGPVVAGDEFNYQGAPNSTKWGVYNSTGHAGKGLRSPGAWNVNGSVAVVTGDEKGTTGGMSAKFDRRKYGRWEVRMRTNVRDPEYHPVVMLWPDVKASTCPEIDFAESTKSTDLVYFFNHHGCSGLQTWARRQIDMTEWHNYAMEWTPAGIVGYIDGVEWYRNTDPTHQPAGSMHAAIQLDWFPDGTVTTPSAMSIDWVRVYNAS